MKNISVIIIVFSLNFNSIIAQDSLYLHLVMFSSEDVATDIGDVRYNTELDKTLPSMLWRLDGDSLVLLDTLNFYKQGDGNFEITEMYECRHFSEEKWIYIMEHEFFPTYYVPKPTQQDSFLDEDTFISVLDYGGDSIVIRRLKGSEYEYFNDFAMYEIPYIEHGRIFYEYSFNINLDHYGDNIISRFLDDGHEIKKDIFIDSFYVQNESGLFYRFHTSYYISKDNEVKKMIYEKDKFKTVEDWPENEMNIPVSDSEHDIYSRFDFLLRTPHSNYVIGRKQRRKPNPDSLELYYVLDKQTEIWDTIYMPNEVKNFNIYNDRYLYGTLWKQCHHCSEWADLVDTVQAFIKKYPDKYSWKYGNYPNLTKSSGKMFIYDLENRKYTEYMVEDRDAELLQIIDGWIYYRVYDEIRKMQLGNDNEPFNKKTIKVLVKNKEVIPNVHHIFLKEKSPVVEEWITPNPHEKEKMKIKVGK